MKQPDEDYNSEYLKDPSETYFSPEERLGVGIAVFAVLVVITILMGQSIVAIAFSVLAIFICLAAKG